MTRRLEPRTDHVQEDAHAGTSGGADLTRNGGIFDKSTPIPDRTGSGAAVVFVGFG